MKEWFMTDACAVYRAWVLWVIFGVVICSFIQVTGHQRTVTGSYRDAAAAWLEHRDLYGGPDEVAGFQYLPHASICTVPITYLPYAMGEMLWRLLCIGSFAAGVWRLACVAGYRFHGSLFPLMTLLSILPALDSARNGQMNLPLAAFMMLAMADLAEKRWWWSMAWLMLGLGTKPLMIVPILLVGVLYPSMMLWRILIGLLIFSLVPFLTGPPEYVIQQYTLFGEKIVRASDPRNIGLFHDLFGMLRSLGANVPYSLDTPVRATAALATLGLAWIGLKQWDRRRGAVLLYTLSVVYILLFSPRTEYTTYALVGPAMGAFAAWELFIDRHTTHGWALIIMVILVTGGYEFGKLIIPGKTQWLHPVITALFLVYVVCKILKPPQTKDQGIPSQPEELWPPLW